MRDTGQAQGLRNFGVPVVEVAGWLTRGRDNLDPWGAVNHHTASGISGAIIPSMGTVVNGRPGLPGPLCNVLQGRDDAAYVIASGKANHGGVGSWQGVSGNSRMFGLEIEYSGYAQEAFSEHRFDTAARIHAAWAYRFHYDADHVCQHFEYAGARKIDLLRAAMAKFGGADGFRQRVQWYIDHPPFKVIEPAKPKYRLDRVLREGMRDTDDNHVIFRAEELLDWCAAKRGHKSQNAGKRDGVFTHVTGDAVEAFREYWFDKYEKNRPPSKRHLQGRTGRVIGQKVWDALNWDALH